MVQSMDNRVTVRLPVPVIEKLEQEAKKSYKKLGTLIRDILTDHIQEKEK